VRKLFPAYFAFALFAAQHAASAADMPARPLLKAPPIAAPAGSWTGFYAGVDVGVQSTRTEIDKTSSLFGTTVFGVFPTDFAGAPNSYQASGTSARFGGYLGYNWQFAPKWLTGIEADAGAADSKATLNGILLPGSFPLVSGLSNGSFSTSTRWDASVRGRFGYLVTPTTLLYLTGGVAWQNFHSTMAVTPCLPGFLGTCFFPGFSDSNSATRAGLTIGGGIEAALWGHWTLRAQYRYSDFGHASFANANTVSVLTIVGVLPSTLSTSYDEKLRTHTATLGLAYKFGDPLPTGDAPAAAPALLVKARPAPAAPAMSWSGIYLGVDGGMRSTRTRLTTDNFLFPTAFDLTNSATTEPFNGTAFRYGAFAGANWQFDPRWLVGVEGDVGSARKTVTYAGIFAPGVFASGLQGEAIGVGTSWDSSVRGRFGYLPTPGLLIYATAGAAWQHFNSFEACPSTQCGNAVYFANASTRVGPSVGGGLEVAATNNLRLRGEYRYANFGTTTYTNATLISGELLGTTYHVPLQTHTVLFGASYLFNGTMTP